MHLLEMIAHLPDVLAVSGDADITAPVEEDQRELVEGGVFVARRGQTTDGHRFIAEAVRRGAAAIVGEQPLSGLGAPYVQVRDSSAALGVLAAAYHGFPSRRLRVIGVTGTDGKTTTSTLIHRLLQANGSRAGLVTTVAATIGQDVLDTGLHITTPGAPALQALLARMVANGLTDAVVEMTSHGLAQGRLNGIDVDTAVITNLRHEHLDFHGSFEAYRAAKGQLFAMLGRAARKPGVPKVSIVNADDPHADTFAAFPADQHLKYSLRQSADIFGEWQPQLGAAALKRAGTLRIVTAAGGLSVESPLPGAYNQSNILAAVAATGGIGPGTAEAIQQFPGIPGRLEAIDEGQPFAAFVDFAHTPNALESVLGAAREMLEPGGRLICVFGSAGLRDREKRRLMAEVSARLAEITVLTAEDPRTESLEAILETMAAACRAMGGIEGETFFRVPDRGEALYRACQMARPGDIVLACGKGHEQSMCFGTIEYPWDDREALRAALRGAPLRTLPTAGE